MKLKLKHLVSSNWKQSISKFFKYYRNMYLYWPVTFVCTLLRILSDVLVPHFSALLSWNHSFIEVYKFKFFKKYQKLYFVNVGIKESHCLKRAWISYTSYCIIYIVWASSILTRPSSKIEHGVIMLWLKIIIQSHRQGITNCLNIILISFYPYNK